MKPPSFYAQLTRSMIGFAAALALAASSALAAQIQLTWDANPATDNVTSYIVYEATSITGPFLPVAVVKPDASPLGVTFTRNPATWFYFVTAIAGEGSFWGPSESAHSIVVNTPAPTTPPGVVANLGIRKA